MTSMIISTLSGLHLIGDLYQCDPTHLSDSTELRKRCFQLCKDAGLTVLGDFFHQFEDAGVTGTVVLAESHIAIHTWPETRTVALDVFVCNHSRDNSDKAHQLFNAALDLLQPKKVTRKAVQRGRYERQTAHRVA